MPPEKATKGLKRSAANPSDHDTEQQTEAQSTGVNSGASNSAAHHQEQPRKRRKVASKELPVVPLRHTQAGRVLVCGQGDSGQLGLGNLIPDNDDDEDLDDPSEIKLPRHAPLSDSDPQVVQVAAGGMHSVALTESGDVYTTGVNDEAALGRRTDTQIWEKEKELNSSVGDAYKWGKVKIPNSHGKIIETSAGDSHTVALTEQGAVWGWGLFRGNSGPYGFLPGQPYALLPTLVYKPTTANDQIFSISSGADHVLAVRRNGTVLSWGYGEQGQLGRLGSRLRNPEQTMLEPAQVPLHNVKGMKRKKFVADSVSAGTFGSFIVSREGATLAFGVNASGQLGLNTTGSKVDDNILHRPEKVSSLAPHKVKAVSAGKAHTLALTDSKHVLSFGLQTYGRLGRSDANNSSDAGLQPGQIASLDAIPASGIEAGHDTSAVVTEKGELFTWGMGTNYQLAKKSDRDEVLPYSIKLDRFESACDSVIQIAFGGQHTLLLVK